MKRTSLKYLLVIVVVLVWGLIFYKVVKVIRNAEAPLSNNLVSHIDDSTHRLVDTFSIMANYADPFLKRSNAIKSMNKNGDDSRKEKSNVNNVTKKVAFMKNWPTITYGGLVSSFAGNKSTALISVNGASYLMKKGDISNEIELVVIAKDSVKLKFQNEFRFIKRYGTK